MPLASTTLGLAVQAQGRHAVAGAIVQATLEVFEATLPPGCANIATLRGNLASLLAGKDHCPRRARY